MENVTFLLASLGQKKTKRQKGTKEVKASMRFMERMIGILWKAEILHHFETTANSCLTGFSGSHHSVGFLRSSDVEWICAYVYPQTKTTCNQLSGDQPQEGGFGLLVLSFRPELVKLLVVPPDQKPTPRLNGACASSFLAAGCSSKNDPCESM